MFSPCARHVAPIMERAAEFRQSNWLPYRIMGLFPRHLTPVQSVEALEETVVISEIFYELKSR